MLAALPGFVDLTFGVPRRSQAKAVGLAHGALNVTALGLFIAAAVIYGGNWNGPPVGVTLGLTLPAAGVAVTVAAGALGWMLVQTYHVGVRLHGQPRTRRGQRPASAGPSRSSVTASGLNAATTGVRRQGRLGHHLGREAPGARSGAL